MSHMLRKIALCSQQFSLSDGTSTRHDRDIERDADREAGIDRTSAVGLFNFGRSYWRSAEQLRTAPPADVTHPDSPITFLLCHAIELYLKAYLRGAGRDVAELK